MPEGGVGGRGVREGGTEGEHVGRRGDGGAPHLLGRQEPGRAHGRADVRERGGPGRPGDAEVDDARSLGGQQDVRRLEVPVHDARLVHGDQALGEGGPDGGDLRRGQRSLLRDLVVQGGAGDVLGGEPRPVGLQVGGDEPGGAAASDPPRRGHLAREPGAELLVLGQVGPDHLQRDPLAAAVGAQIDDPHAARAEPPVQPERADDTRVLAPQAHHRHVHPRCPVRLTSHSLRFRARVRAEAAPSRSDRLSVPGAKLEWWSGTAGDRTAVSCADPQPSRTEGGLGP